MRLPRLYTALALLCCSLFAAAREPAPRFRRIGAAQGLSSSHVQTLHQDARGFLWIGTDNGLNLYDGNSFTVFRFNRHDTTSICGDNIVSIAEDARGFIWIGTESGVCRLDPRTRKARRVNFSSKEKTAVNDDFKCIVYIDKMSRTWMGNSSGLALYDSTKNLFRRYELRENGREIRERISCMLAVGDENSGALLIGTFNGLLELACTPDRVTDAVRRYRFTDGRDNLVTGIAYANGRVLLSTWGYGFGEFVPGKNSFQLHTWDTLRPEQPAAGNIASGAAVVDGQAYFSTSAGLFSMPLDPKKTIAEKAARYMHDKNDPFSLSSNHASCVLADRDGNIWVGTSEGLSVIFRSQQRFQLIRGIEGTLTKIHFDRNGEAWISSWYGHGLQHFDTAFRELKRYAHVPPQAQDANTAQVSDVISAGSGRTWIATFNGLCMLDERTGNFQRFLHEERKDGLLSNRLNALIEDRAGNIWIATYGAGLNAYDPAGNEFISFTAANGLAYDLVWSLYEDRHGTIWIGTNDGISYYNRHNREMRSIHELQIDGKTVRPGVVWSIASTDDGTLWFSTDVGLFSLDTAKRWSYYSTEEGLPARQLGSLLGDDQNNLWISSRSGLSCFRTKEKKFVNYTTQNGLPADCKGSAFARDHNGLFYLGTDAGLLRFDPAAFNRPAKLPEIFLTRLSAAGEEQLLPRENRAELSFAYDQNDILLEFTAPDLEAGSLQRYEYRLGENSDWLPIGNRRDLSLANLAPGRYALSIRPVNSEGGLGAPATLLLQIRPPFWRTSWFIAAMSALALLLIILVVRYVSQRRLREKILRLEKEQAIERERNRISKDMHDDLGSGLTRIAILSEVVKRRLNDPNEAAKQLDTISGSARELVDNLNEIIWTLNPGNDHLESLSAYVREYAHKFFEGHELQLHFDYPGQLPALALSEEQRRNIFLVLKECYHNIAKHAACTEVITALQIGNGRIRFTVSDNGKGFDEAEARRFSNGLGNMRKRMESIGGNLFVESAPRKGTRVIMEIPARKA